MDFWKEYAKKPENYNVIDSSSFVKIRDQIFTNDVILELLNEEGFRKNLFKKFFHTKTSNQNQINLDW